MVLVGLALPMSPTAQVMFDTTCVTCSDQLAMSPTHARLSLSPAVLPSQCGDGTAVSVTVVGAMILVSGIAEIVSAFGVRTWGKFLLEMLLGALYVIADLLTFRNPSWLPAS